MKKIMLKALELQDKIITQLENMFVYVKNVEYRVNTLYFIALSNFILLTILFLEKSLLLGAGYFLYILAGIVWLAHVAEKENQKRKVQK